jgi:UDP-N-acetylmuramyl pentapeptide synthase
MPGEMKQLTDVVAPDAAIVTRIDAVHGMQIG